MTDYAFGVKFYHNKQIYLIICNIKASKNTDDQGHPEFFKKISTIQDLDAAVAVNVLRSMPCHCQSSCISPSGSVNTIFNILHEKLGLEEKSARRLQIWHSLRRRSAHLVGRRRELGFPKPHFFAWSVPSSIFPATQRKESAVSHQADQGGCEDDLGWGQAFCDQRPVRRRLPAVIGGH